ncbi:MAG: riboflavin synthase [Pelagibacteraceae bacterium]|nr:riboflavin synthase [Pelagibacteraceae bacterium]|tara:strand:- start:2268 stop:2858 length:591 start_codon:yes stop_codon:yes gene_type:complete
MFTGIIQNQAKLIKIDNVSKNYTLIVESDIELKKRDIGTSIAIDGVCLTLIKYKIIKKKKNQLFFNISPETLKISNLDKKELGYIFNLEKSLKYGDEIAGHFVQGHVDDTGKIYSISKIRNSWKFWIIINNKFRKYLIKKGSVAINGVSLTINDIKKNLLRIDIIPHTFKKTNFAHLSKGSRVNLEYDLLIKYLKK